MRRSLNDAWTDAGRCLRASARGVNSCPVSPVPGTRGCGSLKGRSSLICPRHGRRKSAFEVPRAGVSGPVRGRGGRHGLQPVSVLPISPVERLARASASPTRSDPEGSSRNEPRLGRCPASHPPRFPQGNLWPPPRFPQGNLWPPPRFPQGNLWRGFRRQRCARRRTLCRRERIPHRLDPCYPSAWNYSGALMLVA